MIRILLAAFALPASAHTFHYSATELNWNTRASSVEIAISLHAEDIEALLRLRQGRVVELDRDPAAEKLVCTYVREVLEVRGVDLKCLGIKTGRDFVDVFLEGKARRAPRWLRNQILLRDLPDQKNHVVLKRDEQKIGKTLDFFRGDDWKPLSLQ